jgi:hypothetical protein
MVQDQVSLLHREEAVAKSLWLLTIEALFFFLRREGNGQLPLWSLNDLSLLASI